MFNMLEAQNGTTLVFFSDEFGIAIWWNGSMTFNVWRDGVEVEVFTNDRASGVHTACQIATEWFATHD